MIGYPALATLFAFLGWQVASAHADLKWSTVAPADGSEVVTTTVVFHQPRMEVAQAILMDISNPASDKFGQYLDKQAVVGCPLPLLISANSILTSRKICLRLVKIL